MYQREETLLAQSEEDRLRAWEEELRQREEILRLRERDWEEYEENFPRDHKRQQEELEQLEQRIRNARRRLLVLTEEYERLRDKLQRLTQSSDTQTASHTPTGANLPSGPSNFSEGKIPSATDSLPADIPLWGRSLAESITWLSHVAGDLLDRAAELRELFSALAQLRSQWLQQWDAALQEIADRQAQLEHWQRDLAQRQAQLEQAEADYLQRTQQQHRRELRLQAAETRCEARLRACQKAFAHLKARWRAATQALHQRELRLQWLLDECQAHSAREHAHWQHLHRQAEQLIHLFAKRAYQCQQQLAQLEIARYRLWQKQQALELAIHTWALQTSDIPAAEELVQVCEQRLVARLADWQRRLEQREHQLAEDRRVFEQLAEQVLHQREQLEAARRQFRAEKLAEQWHAYCQWANLQRDSALNQIVQDDRCTLQSHNARLLHDVEHLAACLLDEPASTAALSRAA